MILTNTTMVSVHIDDANALECVALKESPGVCLKLNPFVGVFIKTAQLPALIGLLQTALAKTGPVEERIDVIRGAA